MKHVERIIDLQSDNNQSLSSRHTSHTQITFLKTNGKRFDGITLSDTKVNKPFETLQEYLV